MSIGRRTRPVSTPSELKELQREWYERLRDEGFVDVELHPDGKPNYSTANMVRHVTRLSPSVANANDACRHYCLHGEFACEIHRMMWERYCDGWSCVRITDWVNSIPRRQLRLWLRQRGGAYGDDRYVVDCARVTSAKTKKVLGYVAPQELMTWTKEKVRVLCKKYRRKALQTWVDYLNREDALL